MTIRAQTFGSRIAAPRRPRAMSNPTRAPTSGKMATTLTSGASDATSPTSTVRSRLGLEGAAGEDGEGKEEEVGRSNERTVVGREVLAQAIEGQAARHPEEG